MEEAGSPGFIVTQELQHCSVVAELRVLLLFKEYCYSPVVLLQLLMAAAMMRQLGALMPI